MLDSSRFRVSPPLRPLRGALRVGPVRKTVVKTASRESTLEFRYHELSNGAGADSNGIYFLGYFQ